MAENKMTLFELIKNELRDERYLELRGLDKKAADAFIKQNNVELMSADLEKTQDEDGRFLSTRALKIIVKYLPELAEAPQEGWLAHCYNYILNLLFPPEENLTEETRETITPEAEDKFRMGRMEVLQILKTLMSFMMLL